MWYEYKTMVFTRLTYWAVFLTFTRWQSAGRHVTLPGYIIWTELISLCLTPKCIVLSREAANSTFQVFGLGSNPWYSALEASMRPQRPISCMENLCYQHHSLIPRIPRACSNMVQNTAGNPVFQHNKQIIQLKDPQSN